MMRFRRWPVRVAALVVALSVACGSPGASRRARSGVRAGVIAAGSLPMPGQTRLGALVVTAGRDVVALGGYEMVGDRKGLQLGGGEVLHPGASSWSALSAGPLTERFVFPGAVWTGTELLVVATPCAEPEPAEDDTDPFCSESRAVFVGIDPATGRVRSLPAPELVAPAGTRIPGLEGRPRNFSGLGWTGREAVFWDQAVLGFLLYDPEAARWQRSPVVPVLSVGSLPAVCVAGSSLWAVSVPDRKGSFVAGPIKTWRLDVAGARWVPLPERPFTEPAPTLQNPRCENGEIVVVAKNGDGTERVVWFDPAAETWEETPPVPLRPGIADGGIILARPMLVSGARVLWAPDSSDRYWVLRAGATEWVARDKPPGLQDSVYSLVAPFDGKVLVSSGSLGGGVGAPTVVDPLEGLAVP